VRRGAVTGSRCDIGTLSNNKKAEKAEGEVADELMYKGEETYLQQQSTADDH